MGSVFALPRFTTNQNEKNNIIQNEKKDIIQDLTEEEVKTSEAAKQGALEILQDALKKKDKVLMKIPERVVLKGEEAETFWMERHAILTEDIIKKLIAQLKIVNFKKDIRKQDTYAYIIQTDGENIIYLCDMFWKAPKYLEKDSQPGILIHELSHFLGTRDITYEENTLCFGCKGSLVKGTSENPSPLKTDYWERALMKAFLNASNIEHEFELILNHKGSYEDGKYSCCGETKRYSVCESSVPDHFHTCTFDKTWETEILLKELHRRSKAIACNLKESYKTIEDMCKSLRNAKGTAKNFLLEHLIGLEMAGVLLPFPKGGLTGSGVASDPTSISKPRETSKRSKLYPMLNECLRFLDIRELLKFLDGTELFADFRQETEFYTFLINILYLIQKEKQAIFMFLLATWSSSFGE